MCDGEGGFLNSISIGMTVRMTPTFLPSMSSWASSVQWESMRCPLSWSCKADKEWASEKERHRVRWNWSHFANGASTVSAKWSLSLYWDGDFFVGLKDLGAQDLRINWVPDFSLDLGAWEKQNQLFLPSKVKLFILSEGLGLFCSGKTYIYYQWLFDKAVRGYPKETCTAIIF